MLTELGKTLRKFRIDRDLKLGEMAEAIDISTSHLSSIEYGRKSITDDILERICTSLSLQEYEEELLKDKAVLSSNKPILSIQEICSDNMPKLKETTAVFARKVKNKSISEKQAVRILEILKKEEVVS